MSEDGPLSQEWFSAAELAALALPHMPATRQGVQALAERRDWMRPEWEGRVWRPRAATGGGAEFHFSVLPLEARAKIAHAFATRSGDGAKECSQQAELWARFERMPEKIRAIARERLRALQALEALDRAGTLRTVAGPIVAEQFGVSLGTLYNWKKATNGLHRSDWLPALAPQWSGGEASAEIAPEAWVALMGDYLRPERPAFSDCFRRLQTAAGVNGWTLPSERTLLRRMEALPKAMVVVAREGDEALKRMYPAQRRDRSHFHALQAVNADGHKWDVFVKWPDEKQPIRPMMVAFQDLYSGKILSWRVDKSANKCAVRLALGDMIADWGIPDACWLDNGRDFASKWITGGTPNRYRFKVKDDEPEGLLTQLNVAVHWTTPYAGQSKPIERAFRDFATGAAKHPEFAGCYTGNTPMAKPENYGSTAVPLDVFLRVIGAAIIEHNARAGRRSAVCNGRSFDEAFAESYEKSLIRKASPDQQRLWLLMAEAVTVSRVDGSIQLLGNRYQAMFLHEHLGARVAVRFDPQSLHDDLHVYSQAGAYLGAAPCIAAVGFDNADAAREHARARNAWRKAVKVQLAAERTMTIAQVAALLPAGEPAAPPETKVVRPVFGTQGNAALKPRLEQQFDEEDALMAGLRVVRFPRTALDGAD